MKHYLRETSGPNAGTIHELPTKQAALKLERELNAQRPNSTDYGTDRDGFPEMHLKKRVLRCDMVLACEKPVTHLDNKGYVYCTGHGEQRKSYGIPCRKLRPHEITKLTRGETLKKY